MSNENNEANAPDIPTRTVVFHGIFERRKITTIPINIEYSEFKRLMFTLLHLTSDYYNKTYILTKYGLLGESNLSNYLANACDEDLQFRFGYKSTEDEESGKSSTGSEYDRDNSCFDSPEPYNSQSSDELDGDYGPEIDQSYDLDSDEYVDYQAYIE